MIVGAVASDGRSVRSLETLTSNKNRFSLVRLVRVLFCSCLWFIVRLLRTLAVAFNCTFRSFLYTQHADHANVRFTGDDTDDNNMLRLSILKDTDKRTECCEHFSTKQQIKNCFRNDVDACKHQKRNIFIPNRSECERRILLIEIPTNENKGDERRKRIVVAELLLLLRVFASSFLLWDSICPVHTWQKFTSRILIRYRKKMFFFLDSFFFISIWNGKKNGWETHTRIRVSVTTNAVREEKRHFALLLYQFYIKKMFFFLVDVVVIVDTIRIVCMRKMLRQEHPISHLWRRLYSIFFSSPVPFSLSFCPFGLNGKYIVSRSFTSFNMSWNRNTQDPTALN